MRRVALPIVLLLLSGCNTCYQGSSFQKVAVHTPGVDYALCTLTTDKNKYVALSPQEIMVERSASPLLVVCEKVDYATGVKTVDARVNQERAHVNYANIRAVYNYPDAVIVKMQLIQKDSVIASAAEYSAPLWEPTAIIKKFDTPVVVPPKEVKVEKQLK